VERAGQRRDGIHLEVTPMTGMCSRRIWLVTFAVCFPGVLPGQQSRTGDVAVVRGAEARWARATEKCDVAALSGMFSDSLVYVHTTGVADDKRGYMRKVSACPIKRVEIAPSSIQVLGDVAVVHGTLRLTFKGREPGNRITYTRVYVRGRPGWQLLASQGTDIAK
jgi:ketosteroid isomerase-like protein